MSTSATRSTGPGGRPPGGDPGKRRAILDAAIDTFLRDGYERATLDVIAERAGVAKQTAYNHFGDKQTLFLAAVEHERAQVATTFGTAIAASDRTDVTAALVEIGHRVLRVLLDERASALRRLIISEVARIPSLRPACADGEPKQLVAQIADLLRSRSELDVEDPATAARQFVSLLVQQGLHASMYGTIPLPRTEADTICTEAANLIVRAFRTDPGPSRSSRTTG
ncbi:TetR/AcrR family transcriptional regulator [Nocardia sp. JW2]|uniref:TetR/AcrR family transcriptional regulator n=1 Tax=Nocardia sp. JW2 TaxID=3450738 RepID=UPI003F436DA5